MENDVFLLAQLPWRKPTLWGRIQKGVRDGLLSRGEKNEKTGEGGVSLHANLITQKGTQLCKMKKGTTIKEKDKKGAALGSIIAWRIFSKQERVEVNRNSSTTSLTIRLRVESVTPGEKKNKEKQSPEKRPLSQKSRKKAQKRGRNWKNSA